MRILLWIGNEANQRALANKIHAFIPLTAIVTESRRHVRKLTVKDLFVKGIEKIFLGQIGKAWFGMLQFYNKKFPSYPDVPLLDVENINSDEAYAFTQKYQPDLIIVSGTRLVKKKLLSLQPSVGILNLHTGLSPYIKGGPNCTNWCIATKQFHLIGNTIMWIDEGVDSGNILATEFTSFNGDESLADIHIKVMEHGHDLYVRSIRLLAEGKSNNITQKDIAEGTTYRNKQWGLKEKFRLMRNLRGFRKAFQSNIEAERKNIRTVPIEEKHA